MPGIKGMTMAKPRSDTLRRKAWQSMRIFRRFTVPDVCSTSGVKRDNLRKFLRNLERHGYVARFGNFKGGRPGEYQPWRLLKDTGPDYPVRCEVCGNPIGYPCKPEGGPDV